MQLTSLQVVEHASRIILDHATDVEFGSIGEMLEDALEGFSEAEYDAAVHAVDDAIRSATVTVSWEPDPGEDG